MVLKLRFLILASYQTANIIEILFFSKYLLVFLVGKCVIEKTPFPPPCYRNMSIILWRVGNDFQ